MSRDGTPGRVIYIAGYGRSGSTLLDRLLGSHPDIASLGEVGHLPEYARRLNEVRCACGSTVIECAVWAETASVLPQALEQMSLAGGFGRLEGAAGLPRAVSRVLLSTAPTARERAYGDALTTILHAARKGADDVLYLVDSSKTTRTFACRPIALSLYGGADVRVVHIVRDARGVVWSVLKRRARDGRPPGKLRRWQLAAATTVSWGVANVFASISGRFLPEGTYFRLRYEDLAGSTDAVMHDLARWLDLDPGTWENQVEGSRGIPPAHQLAGNRMIREPLNSIRADNEWRSSMDPISRAIIWALGWPFLLLYHRPSQPAMSR